MRILINTIANKIGWRLFWLSRFCHYISRDLRHWAEKQNRGEVNIFGIVGLVYLGLMLVVLLTIF